MQSRLTRFVNPVSSQGSRWAAALSQKRYFSDHFVPSDMPKVKQKWTAVEIIKTTTETMKNVAAGKLPFVERQLKVVRPYTSIVSPFFELDEDLDESKAKTIIHVGACTDKGLCGIIGGNVPRTIANLIKKDTREGSDRKHIAAVYGRKGMFKLTAIAKYCDYAFVNMKMRDPNFTYVCDTIGKVLSENPDWDLMKIYFNVYKNSQSFYFKTETIHKLDVCNEIAKVQFPLYECEGDESTINQNLLEYKIATHVYRALSENAASEQGARLQSMDGAVRACRDKSDEYQKIYQKLRKTKITSELVILSAGVACINMNK